jgi:hypothetical protein
MRHPARHSIAFLAIVLACAACAGGASISSGSDPIASASRVSELPPNVGPSDCSPASDTTPVGSKTEVTGQDAKDTLFWALFPVRRPFPSGQVLRVRFAVNGEHGVRVMLGGPNGQEIRLDHVYPDFGHGWGRPGDIWEAIVNFPSPGCWRISVDRTDKHADFWVLVS